MKNASSPQKTMAGLPFISVVIAAYNEEKYLPYCLEALQQQTYPRTNFEIIVVDNNSTDKTAAIAKAAGAKIITEKRQGNIFAVTTGMTKAEGEIIATTDADTIPHANWLQKIAETLQPKEIIGLTGAITLEIKNPLKRVIAEKIYDLFQQVHFFIGKPNFSGFNLAVKRKSFHKVGGIDMDYKMSCDVDLGLRLGETGKVVYAKDVIATTSLRRWEKGFFKTFGEYASSYVYVTWLRKPSPVSQSIVR
ncbi:MAG: glycosyltransferase [Patescibacteria group bacterium]